MFRASAPLRCPKKRGEKAPKMSFCVVEQHPHSAGPVTVASVVRPSLSTQGGEPTCQTASHRLTIAAKSIRLRGPWAAPKKPVPDTSVEA
jgi:hypothetical protein